MFVGSVMIDLLPRFLSLPCAAHGADADSVYGAVPQLVRRLLFSSGPLLACDMDALAQTLAAAFEDLDGGLLVVVTGAGISRASGIDTFRGTEPGAVWKTSDMALATHDYFQRDPVGQWEWYLKRFAAVGGAKPNDAHRALVGLEEWLTRRGSRFSLVTQNIDTLHERAGTREMLKVHGTSDRVRCSRVGCRNGSPQGSIPVSEVDFSIFAADPRQSSLPRCPECGALLRAHVLFFDEFYLEHQDYRFAEAEDLAGRADCLLFVGTSFSVGVTDLYLQAGHRRGISMFNIDPVADESSFPGLQALPAPAEELLPTVLEALAARA